ncbi:MAG: hypothetical protein KGN84_04770 [Acidobacteriota bacterium]|nr:hypothetical protein [Acidobacteriota bacterium]
MSEKGHLTPETVAEYRARQLSPAKLMEVAKHLAGCEACRDAVFTRDSGKRLVEAFGTASAHIEYDELEALAKKPGASAPHLAECLTCAAELEDLRAFHDALTARKRKRTLYPAIGVAIAAVALIAIAVRTPQPAPAGHPAPIIASIRDGSRTFDMDAGHVLHGTGGIDAAAQKMLSAALSTGRLPGAPDESALVGSPDVLLGKPGSEAATVNLDSPVGSFVGETQPEFRWSAPGTAHRFVVSVYTTDFEPVISSPPSESPEWRCTLALRPGETYIWTVSAAVAGKRVTFPHSPEPEARFRVLPAPELQELQTAEASQSDLLLAIEADKLGAFAESEAALERLTAANPGSPLIASLRESLRQNSHPSK